MTKCELILKFRFKASHSLTGHETPHPHLWKLEVALTGKPMQGKIIDLVLLRKHLEALVARLEGRYLNELEEVSQSVRDFPTCESLSQYFWTRINGIIREHFLVANPSVSLSSCTVALCELDGSEMGACRLSL